MDVEGPVRLLICDDHRVLTDALVVVVRVDPDLELVAPPVHTPDEAVELCRTLRPDVVLMDISFGEALSGIEATRRIKAIAPDTNVVMMTAHHDSVLQAEAAEAGASGYLSKSEGAGAVLAAAKAAARGETLFDPRELAAGMARAARQREADRDLRARFRRLTAREGEILRMISEGLGNDAIGERLFISPLTVQTHVRNILAKLEVHSRLQAAALAARHRPG